MSIQAADDDEGSLQAGPSSDITTYDQLDDDATENTSLLLKQTRPRQNSLQIAPGTTWYYSVFIVVNAALGAGLLNFPAAYHHAGGILSAIIMQSTLLLFAVASLLMLAYCSDFKHSSTYQEVVFHMCGKFGHWTSSVLIAVYCFGTCITFFIIIADQIDRVLYYEYGPLFCQVWYLNRSFTMPTSAVLLILPLCFSKKIDFLKHVSAAGVVTVIYVVVFVVLNFYLNPNPNRGPIRTKPQSWTDIFDVVPVICFGYQCHVSAVPVYSCLQKRKLAEFMKAIVIAIFICMIAYTLTAVYGYLSFGADITADILVSYSAKNKLALAAMIMIAAKTYTTYPILLFCGRTALDDMWVAFRQLTTLEQASGDRKRRIFQALLWFATSLALAVFIPNIGQVIDMLGSLAALFIFVFPGLCLMKHVENEDPLHIQRKSKLFCMISCLFVVLGTFIAGLVLVQAIQAVMLGNKHGSKIQVCK